MTKYQLQKTLLQNTIMQFKPIVQKSTKSIIDELVDTKLNKALLSHKEENKEVELIVEEKESTIITTEKEREAFHIVKSLIRTDIEVDRLVLKDTQNYANILLDNNVRKPICRFYFNTSNKYLSVFDENRQENKILINSINDIYNYELELKNSAKSYLVLN